MTPEYGLDVSAAVSALRWKTADPVLTSANDEQCGGIGGLPSPTAGVRPAWCASCPACATAADLEAHRDATTGDGWSIRRGALNFAVLVARRNCPSYRWASEAADVAAAGGSCRDRGERLTER